MPFLDELRHDYRFVRFIQQRVAETPSAWCGQTLRSAKTVSLTKLCKDFIETTFEDPASGFRVLCRKRQWNKGKVAFNLTKIKRLLGKDILVYVNNRQIWFSPRVQ